MVKHLIRVKRTLPRGGGYALQHHLPVFLWKVYCRQHGLSPFNELMTLLGNPRYNQIREECDASPQETEILDYPCLYCPKEFNTEKLLKKHQHKCKMTAQPDPEEIEPEPEYPCSTCALTFKTRKLYKVRVYY